ncbi:hypothetical protein C7446_2565 [Kushneria sinocarnis]|uniref:Uncharacterized protein n=1 Tax=Kushneria sinocarnis TaxID=595502 RepID=A0A420WUM4_9GAMM|nr:hypothetical protein [Kushneria sinocarnis]RKQ97145.1 hypothetical protein C7446_2565 [Kushneria sinocarnis]
MAKYRNNSLGVVCAGGTIVAPGKTGDVDDHTPGLKRLIDRKVLERVDGRKQSGKQAGKNQSRSSQSESGESSDSGNSE